MTHRPQRRSTAYLLILMYASGHTPPHPLGEGGGVQERGGAKEEGERGGVAEDGVRKGEGEVRKTNKNSKFKKISK